MSRYSIRDARNSDTEKLLEISTRVTNRNSRTYLGDKIVDAFVNSDAFTKEITDNIGNMKVIEFKETIIGLCVWHENQLETLMIDCDYQGSGAAKYLLNEVCMEKFKRYDTVYLECFELNKRANAFYRKMGWTAYQQKQDDEIGLLKILYKKEKH